MSRLKPLAIVFFTTAVAFAQNGSRDTVLSSANASPLDGNWHLAGDRRTAQYPAISLFLHLDGTHIVGSGYKDVHCLADPRIAAGGSLGVSGELEPDGTFTLTTQPGNTIQAIVSGRIPAPGATSWTGKYQFTGSSSRTCGMDQSGEFTATLLAPFNRTFAGPATALFDQSPPRGYRGKTVSTVSLSITAAQGPVFAHQRNVPGLVFYQPLTGSIAVKGSPCFKTGIAASSPYNTLHGGLAYLTFTMDDGSELHVSTVFTDAGESALWLLGAEVKGGNCDTQHFVNATLERQP
jgi:hypothetical protein